MQILERMDDDDASELVRHEVTNELEDREEGSERAPNEDAGDFGQVLIHKNDDKDDDVDKKELW